MNPTIKSAIESLPFRADYVDHSYNSVGDTILMVERHHSHQPFCVYRIDERGNNVSCFHGNYCDTEAAARRALDVRSAL